MKQTNKLSRRKFIGSSAAVAAFSMVPFNSWSAPAIQKAGAGNPSSNFGGVKIGAITYSWRSMTPGLENIVKYCKDSGLSNIELMSGDLENYLGAPANPMARTPGQGAPPAPQRPAGTPAAPPAGGPPAGAPGAPQGQGGAQRQQRTPEQEAAAVKYAEDLKNWRISLPMSKVAQARKLLSDNGITAHIVKFSPGRWSDEEIDYSFKVAKAMGAKGVCDEISEEAVKKMAPIAEKNGMFAIFHNHMQFATPGFTYDTFLPVSKAVMMNFDAGHFFGSTGLHPNTIIEKYHDRIFSIHLKDKTGPKTEPANSNQVWGQGETPIADVLLLLKKTKWPIHVDIELEYPIAAWSNQVKETKTCVEYARQILI
jgi:sugar phosphate isomerase/epimerase